MLAKLKKPNNRGFTIIEVMIVLAIAGLIILIVLLAVPALQRSGRNTAIKSDASSVAAAVSEYESNNDGTPPKSATGTGTITVCDASPCGPGVAAATAKVQGGTAVTSHTGTAPLGVDPGVGNIAVYFGFRCDNTPVTRATAVLYDVETSGAAIPKCIDT
jgi:prepilin-type N-terminal cleavage/methylation domain-containing protein